MGIFQGYEDYWDDFNVYKGAIFYECKDKISIVIYEEDLRTFKPVN